MLVGWLGACLVVGCASVNNIQNPEMPNPYTAGLGQNQIIFNDLDASCTIKIYTLSGELVRTIVESDGDGQAVWDTKNEAGDALESGTYQYLIENSGRQKKGKIVIIR